MNIINPTFRLKKNNIFELRKKEYSEIEEKLFHILKPVEKIGFTIKEFGIRDVRNNFNELQYTIKDCFVIKLEKNGYVIDLSFYFPRLIDNQYFIINGMKKVPIIQLYDIPFIIKKKIIKFKSNVLPISVYEKKELPYIRTFFLKKSVPLALLFYAYYGPEKVRERFLNNNLEENNYNDLYKKFILDLKEYNESSQDMDKGDFIKEVGRIFITNKSSTNEKLKGENILYALDLAYECDIEISKFFITDNILDELEYVLKNNETLSDTDILNRRLRFREYYITSYFSNVIFNLCMTNKDKKKPKFNINSKQLISDANVSDIIQYDFSLNPIDELSKLSRTTILGPGGFARDKTPKDLRDIDESMFGRICAIDTPDRENCGILLSLLPNVDLDENLKFTEKQLEEESISNTVSMVPFLQNDDQTRLQMSSSQMRQSIMLESFDTPMIQSGNEILYGNYSNFIKIAKKDGEVVYSDNNYLMVKYDDNTHDIFDLSIKNIMTHHLDFYKLYYKLDDKFKEGDILAESNFYNNGNIVFGKNLLTAVMPFYGYNFEDGIVISDKLVKNRALTSVHFEDLSFTLSPTKILLTLKNDDIYCPIPNVETWVEKDGTYGIIREIFNEKDLNCIFNESLELKTKKKTFITKIEMFANTWNKEIPEFNDWIENKIEEQRKKEINFLKELSSRFSKNEFKKIIKENNLNKFSGTGKYKIKNELIDGVYFNISGIYLSDIKIGDR